jgi:hypothetical protein
MGAISLFPLSGAIPTLRNFFPTGYRALYVTFSTIFSLIIYLYLQSSFEKLEGLPYFISIWISVLWAFISLIIYIGIVQSFKSQFRTFSSVKKAIYIIITLIFYISLISSLTYSFNVLENFEEYDVIRGTIIFNFNNERVTQRVEIKIKRAGEIDKRLYSKKNGRFFLIIKKNRYSEGDTIKFEVEKDGNSFTFTEGLTKMPMNQDWLITLGGSTN